MKADSGQQCNIQSNKRVVKVGGGGGGDGNSAAAATTATTAMAKTTAATVMAMAMTTTMTMTMTCYVMRNFDNYFTGTYVFLLVPRKSACCTNPLGIEIPVLEIQSHC